MREQIQFTFGCIYPGIESFLSSLHVVVDRHCLLLPALGSALSLLLVALATFPLSLPPVGLSPPLRHDSDQWDLAAIVVAHPVVDCGRRGVSRDVARQCIDGGGRDG